MVQKFMMQNHMQEQIAEQSKLDQKIGGNLDQGIWVEDLICPKCCSKGVFLKKGEMALCKDCLKIEKGLGNNIHKENNIHPEVQRKGTTTLRKVKKEESKNESKDTPGDKMSC